MKQIFISSERVSTSYHMLEEVFYRQHASMVEAKRRDTSAMGVYTKLGYTMGGLYDKLECATAVRLWTEL